MCQNAIKNRGNASECSAITLEGAAQPKGFHLASHAVYAIVMKGENVNPNVLFK